MAQHIQLSDHFTYKKIMRFTLPSIAMQIFSAVYGIVDGIFVSNYVGKTPFAGLNFIFPFLIILGTIGFMFGTGGSALVGKTLGEGRKEKANELFSLFIYLSIACGIGFAVLGMIFVPHVASFLGAEGELLKYSVQYGRVVLIALPAWVLQMAFQMFFVTAEKPRLGFLMSVISGVFNIVLDALFIIVFHWGLTGAAAATAIAQCIGGIFPVVYFFVVKDSPLKLGKTHMDLLAVRKALSNGLSEFVSDVSMSLVGMLYNVQLLKYAGENGVAAYGIIMYIDMVFFSAFIGYSLGISPVISFHYGAQDHKELTSLFKKSIAVLAAFSLLMFAAGELLSGPLGHLFAGYDETLMNMTIHGFRIYSISFLICAGTIFASAFFTALNNGVVSAVISFVRVAVFEVLAVLFLPLLFGIDGIWWAVVIARLFGSALAVIFLVKYRGRYHYWGNA